MTHESLWWIKDVKCTHEWTSLLLHEEWKLRIRGLVSFTEVSHPIFFILFCLQGRNRLCCTRGHLLYVWDPKTLRRNCCISSRQVWLQAHHNNHLISNGWYLCLGPMHSGYCLHQRHIIIEMLHEGIQGFKHFQSAWIQSCTSYSWVCH